MSNKEQLNTIIIQNEVIKMQKKVIELLEEQLRETDINLYNELKGIK